MTITYLQLLIIKVELVVLFLLSFAMVMYGVYRLLYYFIYRHQLAKYEREQAIREAERIIRG